MSGAQGRPTTGSRPGSAASVPLNTALDPAGWSDRFERGGLHVRYTTVGCRPRGTSAPVDVFVAHPLASVLVGSTRTAVELDADTAYWVTVSRRLLQRGTLPAVPSTANSTETIDGRHVAALFEPSAFVVDPSIELDARYEQPFFKDVCSRYAAEAVFLFPQAPFESCGIGARGGSTQWVDFLFSPPRGPQAVLEIDGGQHKRAKAVDKARDAALLKRGVKTVRVASSGGRLDSSTLFAEIRSGEVQKADLDVHGFRLATNSVRLAYGLVEAVVTGLLPPAVEWIVSVDNSDFELELLRRTLDLLAAIDTIWSTEVLPQSMQFIGKKELLWSNPFPCTARELAVAETTVVVDWGPSWAELPDLEGDGVVVRGVPIPAHAGWDQPLVGERRNLSPAQAVGPHVERALSVVADYVLDIPSFRPGQVRALLRVLDGKDALVLLPTGSGKSLIYQLAMCLRPGTTLVVDPIKALIDDQERRFLDEGIDRVAAIHSGRTLGALDRVVLGNSIARQNSIVALVSPERLQVAGFREALSEAATTGLVNLAVIDEAHCVSEWGHDFRTSYLRLAQSLRRFGRDLFDVPPPLLALTGTASPAVLRDVSAELAIDTSDPESIQRPHDQDRSNLSFQILAGDAQQTWELFDRAVALDIPEALGFTLEEMAAQEGNGSVCGLVFVPWASTTAEFGVGPVAAKVVQVFQARTVPPPAVAVYSGAMNDSARAQVATEFRRNEANVLVATKAFGMGIDKPNIRWTIHVGIPSSIEGFVQEAGRSGRDGRHAHCVIVSARPAVRTLREHLDANVSPRTRRLEYDRQSKALGDVGRQLFFLYNSFPGGQFAVGNSALAVALRTAWNPTESGQAEDLYRQLRAQGEGPLSEVTIPRTPQSVAEHLALSSLSQRDRDLVIDGVHAAVDKALHRLAIIGVIDDLTVDYGADTVTVHLARFTHDSVDEATLRFAAQVRPGKFLEHQAAVLAASDDLGERIAHHLRFVVSLIYEVIEPARLNALVEMWRLTLNEPTDEAIRGTISAYLGAGPTSILLADLVAAPNVDVRDALERLATNRGDEYDWAGAAARLLEAYPGHPILLYVRTGGEAHLPQGTNDGFREYLAGLLRSFDEYSIDAEAQTELFRSLSGLLRNAHQGRRAPWLRDLWSDWYGRTGRCAALDDAAASVLAAPTSATADELDAVLAYRLLATRELANITATQVDPRSEPQ